jgi:branched-chain amino acid transport system permease protein
MADQTGLTTEPALGVAPAEVAAPVPPGGKVPLWPPVPRAVLTARIVIGVVISAAALYAPFYFDPTMNRVLSQAIYLAIAAMGLNLLLGFNGQVSIGHGAFYGVGAFTSAILMIEYGWSFEPTIIVSAVLTGIVGLLIGLPALRVRGLYLALVTLGLAVLFPRVAKLLVGDPDEAVWPGTGSSTLLRPSRQGFTSLIEGLADDQWVYFLSLAIMVLLFFLAWNLTRGRMGRAMIAVRDQEIAATTVGVHLAGTKVGTFAISAAYAGVAGSLSLMVDTVADGTNPALYFQRSIEFLVAMTIGGAATILGPAVGALLLVLLRRNTQDLIEGKEILAPAVYGGALILVVFVLPEGVVGGVRRMLAALGRRSSAKGRPPTHPIPDDSQSLGGPHDAST